MFSRGQISFALHSGFDVLAGPVLMAAPFFIDFPVTAGVATFVLGVLLVGLAFSGVGVQDERGSIPLSAHAAFDRVIAVSALTIGAGIALVGGFVAATVFMAGFGIAHLALTAATQFSAPRGT
jgi:hypothetical protein